MVYGRTTNYPHAYVGNAPGLGHVAFPRTKAEAQARCKGHEPSELFLFRGDFLYESGASDKELGNYGSASAVETDSPTAYASELSLAHVQDGVIALVQVGTGVTDILENANNGDDIWWVSRVYMPSGDIADVGRWMLAKYHVAGSPTYGYVLQVLSGSLIWQVTNTLNTVTRQATIANPPLDQWVTMIAGYSVTNGISYLVCVADDGNVTTATGDISAVASGDMNNDGLFWTSLQSPALHYKNLGFIGFETALTLPEAVDIAAGF